MRVVRDLIGGNRPAPMDLYFNAQVGTAGGDKVWPGALVKVMNIGDIDEGRFLVPNHAATRGLNIFGILEETVGSATADGALGKATATGLIRRKVTPIFPSTLIRAEYMRQDEEAGVCYETFTATAAGTTVTGSQTDTDDLLIGGWIYFYTGPNAGIMSYITDSTSDEAITIATALPNAMGATDRGLVICPAFIDEVEFNALSTGILSDTDDGNWTDEIVGIDVWFSSPGHALTHPERDTHDAVNVGPNARFFHDFCIAESSVWTASTQ